MTDDKPTIDRIKLLHPKLRDEATLIYHNYGLAVDIILLVDKDANGTYESALWDVKSDFDGDNKSDWMEIVAIFKRHGWEWGGDWKFYDAPHFQKTLGKSIVELLKMHNSKKFMTKTTYVDLD